MFTDVFRCLVLQRVKPSRQRNQCNMNNASPIIGFLLTHKRIPGMFSTQDISNYQSRLIIAIPVSVGYALHVINNALCRAGKGVNDGSV